MRSRSRFLLALLAAVSLTGCGSTPTAPTPAPTPPAPILPATLAIPSGATLSAQNCQTVSVTGIFACAAFSGIMQNTGSGCAANIRGTTTITRTSDGTQIGNAEWTYPNLVRAGEQFSYSGGQINVTQAGTWVYNSTASWDNVRCQ